jgi:hypothetical protein
MGRRSHRSGGGNAVAGGIPSGDPYPGRATRSSVTAGMWQRASMARLCAALFCIALVQGQAAIAVAAAPPQPPPRGDIHIPTPKRPLARFAIVIGNNQAESADTPNLRYADDDAVANYQLLIEAGVESCLLARLDADTLRLHPALVTAGPPRAADFERVLAALFERMRSRVARGETVELLLFYSGHGDVEQGEGFVLLEDRRLTRTMLYALLARSPATLNHVVIDACKSYFLAFDRGPGGQRAPYVHSFGRDSVPATLSNTGFILSTSSGRDSHEWERYQGGILSHELRSGLRGAADADHDGRITYAELGAFLSTANQAIPNAQYRPDFMVRPPKQDLEKELLTWRSDSKANALRIEATAIVGHVYVETGRGERLLDAHPSSGQDLLLHLPAERPLFVRRYDESAEQIVVGTPASPISALTPIKPEIAMRGALRVAFSQLFASTFGASDVVEFERRHDSLEISSDEPQPAWDAPRIARVVSASIAIMSATSSLVLAGLSWERYESGAGASQVEIERLNRSIHRLNFASTACLIVAGAATFTWAGTHWRSRVTADVEPRTEGGMTVGLRVGY